MAATDPGPPDRAGRDLVAAEPPTADLGPPPPRPSTRLLTGIVVGLAVLLVIGVVVALVLLHQPHLTPVPVPSVPSIA